MTHIQKALKSVDDRGKYQKILVAILIVIYTQLGLILLGTSFIYMNPIFECQGLTNPSQETACALKTCKIVNDFTATAYAGLICEEQAERSLIQSTVYIGAILGLLVITPFADTIGKKKLFVLTQGMIIVGLILNIVGIYAKMSVVIIIGQVILGGGGYSALITGYVIISELAEDKFKQYSIITLNFVWALSQIFISGFYFWFNYWSDYLIYILLLPNILTFVAIIFFLVESPYFLLEKKKDIKGALASMKKIASVNGVNEAVLVEVEAEFKLAIEECEESERKEVANRLHGANEGNSRFAIFKDRKHLKVLLAVAVLEFGTNAYYYGVQFSLGQIGTDFGHNILLTGIIEATAYFTSNIFITKVPRRMGVLGFNLVCVCMGMLFFIDFGMVAQTVLLGACRFFNTYSMAIIPMMQNEPFPHKYRSIAWGYIEGLSQIGNFITPYIVTGCQNSNINPLIIFSFMLVVIGTVPLLFYRETLNLNEDTLVKIEEEEDLKESMQTDQSSDEIHKDLIPSNSKGNHDL